MPRPATDGPFECRSYPFRRPNRRSHMRESTGLSTEPAPQGPCPYCSTENDYFYTFCRNCLQELPSRTG
ncbi:DUF7577 domain-containing protein [Natrialba asiatica]